MAMRFSPRSGLARGPELWSVVSARSYVDRFTTGAYGSGRVGREPRSCLGTHG
jgi:hypothetical protein